MIPPPACQERAYESDDQVRSCISSRSHRSSGGEPWAVIKQVVGMISTLGLVLICITVGCNAYREDEPPKIRFGEDACDECRMIISEERSSASSLDSGGMVLKYDDIGCMILNHRAQAVAPKRSWVHDHETGKWIEAEKALYVFSEDFHTPMAYGIRAFSDEEVASRLAGERKGRVLLWDELKDLITLRRK
ncbi:MAG: nitrous oxide reductase accessory protein NosL [Candidatus Omnitrophica bacterium]|nr:nitrous oxide reductase accessory protein NosL [Candidatus Omnitrophota bacterium]